MGLSSMGQFGCWPAAEQHWAEVGITEVLEGSLQEGGGC